MEKLIVLVIGITAIILGARGTYVDVWNMFFPNESIAPASANGGAYTVPSQGGTYPVTPGPGVSNQQSGTTGASNGAPVTPYMGNNPTPGFVGSTF